MVEPPPLIGHCHKNTGHLEVSAITLERVKDQKTKNQKPYITYRHTYIVVGGRNRTCCGHNAHAVMLTLSVHMMLCFRGNVAPFGCLSAIKEAANATSFHRKVDRSK